MKINYTEIKLAGLNVSRFAIKYCKLNSRQALYSLLISTASRDRALNIIKKGLKKLIKEGHDTKKIQKLLKAVETELSKRKDAYRVLNPKSSKPVDIKKH
jgi:hypothetical protein